MTKVCVWKSKEGVYQSFTCEGHAGYAEAGEDIVCAGISAIVINTINCLTDLLQEDLSCSFDEESGSIDCYFRKNPDEKAALLIDCMIHGLKWIQQQYGKRYLIYEIKEV